MNLKSKNYLFSEYHFYCSQEATVLSYLLWVSFVLQKMLLIFECLLKLLVNSNIPSGPLIALTPFSNSDSVFLSDFHSVFLFLILLHLQHHAVATYLHLYTETSAGDYLTEMLTHTQVWRYFTSSSYAM